MPFTVFTRQVLRTQDPQITFTALGRMNLNSAAASTIAEHGANKVLLLWDAQQHRVAVQACFKKADPRAYQVRYGNTGSKRGANFSAISFFKFIGYDFSTTKSYPAMWNDGEKQFEITIPISDFLKKPKNEDVRLSLPISENGTHSRPSKVDQNSATSRVLRVARAALERFGPLRFRALFAVIAQDLQHEFPGKNHENSVRTTITKKGPREGIFYENGVFSLEAKAV